jgi:hypothetical protein
LLTQQDDFALQPVNFVPGFLGLYMGYLSPVWLIAFVAGVGLLCGWGERALFARWTPARTVLLASALTTALQFGEGFPGMLVELRTGIALAVAVRLADSIRGRGERRRGSLLVDRQPSHVWLYGADARYPDR